MCWYDQDKSAQDIHELTSTVEGKAVTVVQRMAERGGQATRRDISEVLCETIDALSEAAVTGATALVVYSLSEVSPALADTLVSLVPRLNISVAAQVIEAAGEECALNWLEVLATAATSTVALDAKDAKDTKESKPKKVLVLSVVHTSLHSPETLARIEVQYTLYFEGSQGQCILCRRAFAKPFRLFHLRRKVSYQRQGIKWWPKRELCVVRTV